MRISLIVAASENNAIGKNNQLLWHLPADMKFFKATTWGLPVIMGRKTFESLNGKPLPGRYNIVISSDAGFSAPGVLPATSVDAAIERAAATACREVFVIGGGAVYEQTMARASSIYLTRVHTNIEGDTFFPAIDTDEWKLHAQRHCQKDDKHLYDYTFEHWRRIS